MPFWLNSPYNVAGKFYSKKNRLLVVYKLRVLMNSRGWSVWRKLILKYILLLVPYHIWSWSFKCEWYWTSATNTVTGISFLDLYIYTYISVCCLLLIYWLSIAVTYWCLIIFFTLSIQVSVLSKYLIMILFISVFTINISFNDILFCLFKISFVCWQWL